MVKRTELSAVALGDGYTASASVICSVTLPRSASLHLVTKPVDLALLAR